MTQANVQTGQGDRFWSTSGFEQSSKLSQWTDIVSSHMTEMVVDSDQPEIYDAQWRQFNLGKIDLNLISAREQCVRRTPAMIARGGTETFELVYMRRGSLVLRYEDGAELVEQGDFTFLRHGEPYEFRCLGDSVSHCAHVSERWLRQWMPDVRQLGRLDKDARRNWGRPLASLLEAIADNGLQAAMLPRQVIADQIGSLLGLMSTGPGTVVSTHQANLFRRALDILHYRFDEVGLDPAAIAEDLGVSKRALHGVFAASQTTFGKELAEIRMNRASRMLADPRQSRRSIAEIAADVGFLDPSHFARRFRQHHGQNPVAFRKSEQSYG